MLFKHRSLIIILTYTVGITDSTHNSYTSSSFSVSMPLCMLLEIERLNDKSTVLHAANENISHVFLFVCVV